MQNLQGLETQALIDMIIQQTAQLTAKIAEKNTIGVEQYEYEISMLQAELNSRQQTKDNTSISNQGIEFTSGTT